MACITSSGERARTENQLFRAFSEQRRRVVLQVLRQHRELSLSELAKAIAVLESEKPLAEIPSQEVRRLLIDLYHSQIPLLAEIGLLNYTEKHDRVALSDQGKHTVEKLDAFFEPGGLRIGTNYP